MHATACPPPQKLRAYLSGKLDLESSEVLASHLTMCADCERTLTDLEQEPDSLVELLQVAPKPENHSTKQLYSKTEMQCSIGITEHPLQDEPQLTRDPILASLPPSLGQYELQSRLGVGGMGAVYLARHRSLDKPVAVKLLPALPAENEEFVARFQREMRAAGQLEHPAIVRTTDAGEQHGIHFLVMDYIDGLNLSSIARAEEKLLVADACEMVRQAAIGLAHAHEKGIVHRDVKPSNLMLDTAGQVRILDFGLAQMGCWESGSAEITTVGQLMGTLDYMAPEQAERGGAVDYRADLYALGATLFRLLTGRAPLAAAPNLTPLEKLRLLATHKPPKLRSLRPDAPESLAKIVDAMLSRDPALRPASATHVAELLDPFGKGAELVGLLKRARSKPQTHEPRLRNACSLLARDVNNLSSQQASNKTAPAHVSKSDLGNSSGYMNRLITWTALAGCVAAAIAGVLFVVETSKGQLVIDSNVDVQVKIVKLEEGQQSAVEELEIQPGTQSTRLRSGMYRITLDSASDSFSVRNGTFVIRNGQTVVASITPKSDSNEAKANEENTQGSNVEDNRLTEILYDGQTLDTWIRRLKFERNPTEVNRTLNALEKLSEPSLREVIEQPLADFLVRNSELDDAMIACNALAGCTGEDFPTVLNSILKRLRNHGFRTFLLMATNPAELAKTVRTDSEFIATVAQILSGSKNADDRSTTSSYLRVLADLSAGESASELQKRVTDLFVRTKELTDDEFWLVYPINYDTYHSKAITANPSMRDEIIRRAIRAATDETTPNRTYVKAILVLRSLYDAGFSLSDPQRTELAKGLSRTLVQGTQSPELATVEAEVPRQLQRFGLPVTTLGEFRNSRTEFKPNKLISALNLIAVGKLEPVLTQELTQLHESFSSLPLNSSSLVKAMQSPTKNTWTDMLLDHQNGKIPANYLPNRIIYLQSGFLTGKKENELFDRFEKSLAADVQLQIENALKAIENSISTGNSAWQDWGMSYLTGVTSADYPPRAAEVLGKYFEKSSSRTDSESLLNFAKIWSRACGSRFLEQYGKVVKNADEINRRALLSINLTKLEELEFKDPSQLNPLLEVASEIYDKPANKATRGDSSTVTMDKLMTRTLASLLAESSNVTAEVQQRLIDFLEQQGSLDDTNFWLRQPNSVKDEPHYGVPMRQAILRHAIKALQLSGNSPELQCPSLALIKTAISNRDPITADQRKALIEQASIELQRTVKSPKAYAGLVLVTHTSASLEPSFNGVDLQPISNASSTAPRRAGFEDRNFVSLSPRQNYGNLLVLYLNVLSAMNVQSNAAEMQILREELESLHQKVEAQNIMANGLLGWGSLNLSNIGDPENFDVVMHTWYKQTGVMLGKDYTQLSQRPYELVKADRERQRRFVNPKDTLSIHIPSVLPRSGEPPVIQAGKSTPVSGFPVPVSAEGQIDLPFIEPLNVKDLELPQVHAAIEKAYKDSKVLSGDKPLGITVHFLLRANQSEELRNIAGNGSVTVPEK